VTPIPGQPDVARDWWLSASWKPPTPATATELRGSLTSGQVVALFEYDSFVSWAAVSPGEVTADVVECARLALAAVIPPCLESPRTWAKRLNAALRGTGLFVHVLEYPSHE